MSKSHHPGPIDRARRFFRDLGPGLVTGAADDDPSGISTYSVTGSQFGFGLIWTVLFTFPLMTGVQLMCARLGLVAREGFAAALRQYSPRWLLVTACILLIVANVVNIAADLSGMAESLEMVSGVSHRLWLPVIAIGLTVAVVFWSYKRLAKIFKWLTLTLVTYILAAFLSKPKWGEVLRAAVVPHIELNRAYLATLVGVLGTTITPYMFFWQSAQEVEEIRESHAGVGHWQRLLPSRLRSATTDVVAGMGWAGVVMFFIILTSATSLHKPGMPPIESAQQAATALRPVAGEAAYLLFALGIVGAGVLAVPVLAGSAAYALSEAMNWKGSLDDKPRAAPHFYAILILAVLMGLGLSFAKVAAVKVLFISAVVNGILAPPLVAMVTWLTSRSDIMGKHVNPPILKGIGWFTAAAMSIAVVAMFVL
jgi:NRAMP (natural resistance-associated macrophage protein)-like metal ion transporter